MTPSMNMGAPKGTQAPAAGLAAIAQPAQAPKGKSPENMGQIMALARKMTDSQLSDVLNGKSLDVPQFAAMTEAMGRKSLRQAVEGQQAMAQAKKPSLKDKFMSEQQAEMMPQQMPPMMPQAPQGMPQQPVMAAGGGLMYADGGSIDMNEGQAAGGLAELPAPNMIPMTMAEGGIIAFSDGGTAKERRDRALEALNASLPDPVMPNDYSGTLSDFLADPTTQKTAKERRIAEEAIKRNNPIYSPAVMAQNSLPSGSVFPKNSVAPAASPADVPNASPALAPVDTGSKPDPLGRHIANADVPSAPPRAPSAPTGSPSRSAGPDGMPSYDSMLKQKTTDYLAKLEGMGDKKRAGLSELKDQIGSQAALQLSSALLGSRNLAEAGSKFGQQAASTLSAGRAEKRSIENEADSYDFNMAKAREAAEKGDMALALQYAQVANTNKYQMGSLDVQRGRNAILGEGTQLGKVQLGLANADKQAYNEAKTKFGDLPMNKKNQTAFDAFVAQRSKQLKMQNPLTRQYADLGGSDLGSKPFNTVQSLPKGASVVDLES